MRGSLLEKRSRRLQAPPAAGQQRHAPADLALEPQQDLRERVAEHEVQAGDHGVDLERTEGLGRDELPLRHQLRRRDCDQQGRRLEQIDEHRVRARQRQPERLGEDDVGEGGPAPEAERLGRLLLAQGTQRAQAQQREDQPQHRGPYEARERVLDRLDQGLCQVGRVLRTDTEPSSHSIGASTASCTAAPRIRSWPTRSTGTTTSRSASFTSR
jgi:hypothetical protein